MNNIICFETEGMEGRAWCRIERIMFASFCAPTQDIIAPDFAFSGAADQSPLQEEFVQLKDATRGEVSCASDVDLIRQLLHIASQNWGYCWKDGLLKLVENSMKGVATLDLGVTQVRARVFSQQSGEFLKHFHIGSAEAPEASSQSPPGSEKSRSRLPKGPVEKLSRAFHMGGPGDAPPAPIVSGTAPNKSNDEQWPVRRFHKKISISDYLLENVSDLRAKAAAVKRNSIQLGERALSGEQRSSSLSGTIDLGSSPDGTNSNDANPAGSSTGNDEAVAARGSRSIRFPGMVNAFILSSLRQLASAFNVAGRATSPRRGSPRMDLRTEVRI